MKKIIFILACILGSTIASAQNTDALFVKLQNGHVNAFYLAEKPVITMQGTSMVITGGSVNTSYERAEVEKIYFGNMVGVEDINAINQTFHYVDGENVRITGLADKTKVTVVSLDGKSISTQQSGHSGNVTISLANLPKGVYIISYGNRSVKIRR